MASDIISKKTRREFREVMVSWILRDISDEFNAAGLTCNSSYEPPNISGKRRCLVEQYYNGVDWTSSQSVKPVLAVFENTLTKLQQSAVQAPTSHEKQRLEGLRDELIEWLRKHGLQVADGRVVLGSGMARLADVRDSANSLDAVYLHSQIERMEEAIEDDPALAIGTAKELIETVCKTILSERGKPLDGTPELPNLTKETFKELKLVPEGIPDEAKGAKAIKVLLSNLATIANNLAEIRNLYGTGHGKGATTKGLSPRHAKLAVGAASTLATFLFETHREGNPQQGGSGT